MTELFHCDDKEQLVAYLYDELDEVTRRRIDEHLWVCATCAEEVGGLSGVRQELAGWAPPDAELGFSIVPRVRAEVPAPRPVHGWHLPDVPAWAQAMAAVLVMAAGLAIANVQVRYDANGLVMTTGWMEREPPPAPAATSGMAAAPRTDGDWRPALAALESTLRDEILTARRSAAPVNASNLKGADVPMQRVAQLIEESEQRQQQQLALRLTQFNRDLEVQRRSDLVRIDQGFGQFEGRAGAEIARQRQMLDYIMRVSAQPPPQ
jgi:Putative zinc-finger